MRKIMSLFFVVALTVFLFGRNALADNLLLNSDFENGLNDWTTGVGGWPFSLSLPDERHGGEGYAATDAVDSVTGEDYWGQIYQEVSYSQNTPIYGTLYTKTDISPLARAKSGLLLQFLNSLDEIIGSVQDEIGGQTDWRYLYISTTTPSGTAKVRFSGYLFAPEDDIVAEDGQAWIDDAVLSSDFIEPPTPHRSLINPGFENGLNDWTDLSGFPSEVSQDVKHSGNYASKKTVATVGGQDYWSQILQELAVTAGRSYTARLWTKTDMNVEAQARAGLLIQFLDANGQIVGISPLRQIGGQTDWRQLSINGTIPTGAVKVRFSGFIWAPIGDLPSVGGKAYYDDASFSGVIIHVVPAPDPFHIELE